MEHLLQGVSIDRAEYLPILQANRILSSNPRVSHTTAARNEYYIREGRANVEILRAQNQFMRSEIRGEEAKSKLAQYITPTGYFVPSSRSMPVIELPEPLSVVRRDSGLLVKTFGAPRDMNTIIAYQNAHPNEHPVAHITNRATGESVFRPFSVLSFGIRDDWTYRRSDGDTVVEVDGWSTSGYETQGSCDTNHFRVVHAGPLKLLTLKSKHNNCLIACFAFHMKSKLRHKTIIANAKLSSEGVPKSSEDIAKLCDHFKLYCRVWQPCEVISSPMACYGSSNNPTIDIMLKNGHYYYITSGCPAMSCAQVIESNRITRSHLSDDEAPVLDEMRTIVREDGNDDFSALVEMIATSESHWIIDGGAGTGKSHLSMMLANALGPKLALTATTGIAAHRIGGVTIDRYLLKNSSIESRENIILIDEISMCDGTKMDQIVQFALKKKMRLILVGDVMQLPPVQGEIKGFFFQSELIHVLQFKQLNLTKVRRTNNVPYAQLCARIRLGCPTTEDLEFLKSRYMPDANPREYDLFVASTNARVDEYNKIMYDSIAAPEVKYPAKIADSRAGDASQEKAIRAIHKKRDLAVKVGARVIATQNRASEAIANGMLGSVIKCESNGVLVQFDGVEKPILVSYCEKSHGIANHRTHCANPKFIPLHLAYALTVHKCQGLTCRGRMLFECANMFAKGMYYVAITRVSDPINLTITQRESRLIAVSPSAIGRSPPHQSYYQPDENALRFIRGERVKTITETITREDGDSECYVPKIGNTMTPLDTREKHSVEPHSVLYFDFETADKQDEHRIQPYFCSWSYSEAPNVYKPLSSGIISDIPDTPDLPGCSEKSYLTDADGNTVTVSARIIAKILDMMHNYEELINARLRTAGSDESQSASFGKYARDIRKFSNRTCPRICAYNGAGFDLWFIAQQLFNGKWLDPSKYAMSMIFKGSQIVEFRIISKTNYCTLLKSHDLCQLIQMPLKDACRSFLDKDDPEGSKIDFHDEIMDISKNRYGAWKDWKWADFKRKLEINVRVFPKDITDTPERLVTTKLKEYLPSDVLEYGVRDTVVLAKIYRTVNQVVHQISGVSAWTFLTIGGMTWYCGCQHAKKIIPLVRKKLKHVQKRDKEIDLYSCTRKQDAFIRQGIYGGRSCPRIIYDSDKVRGSHVYVDISGMYGSIQQKAELPHGVISEVDSKDGERYINIVKTYCADLLTKAGGDRNKAVQMLEYKMPTYWMGEIEFQENQNSLEPVISEKTKHGTRYSVEKRTAVITSMDLALILLKGGTYFSCKRMLHFAAGSKWAQAWADICLEGKTLYKKTNYARSLMYKLLLNAFYGQGLKRDHEQDYCIVSRPDQTEEFLRKYDWDYAITGFGDYDIMYGRLKQKSVSFMTTRPTYAGAFVLSYSRMMIQQILSIANPDENPEMQPALGDTDSLLIPLEGALRLEAAGWFPYKDSAKPGQLTDELADTFLTKTSYVKPEDLPLYKGKLFLARRWFSPAPKVLAVEFEDPVTHKLYYKYRCKGVAANSVVDDASSMAHRTSYDSTLMSAGTLFDFVDTYKTTLESNHEGIAMSRDIEGDWENPSGICAHLPCGIKKVTPGSVQHDDRVNSKTIFNLRSLEMTRNILRNRWEGRVYLGDGITVPFGWARM